MASAVHQRYVWGFDLPVVGVVVSNKSTTVMVVIGWIEKQECVDDWYLHLSSISTFQVAVMLILNPPIRMAHSVKEILNYRVFDLKNSRSALLFAQFLALQLQVPQGSATPRSRSLCWRAGHLLKQDVSRINNE